MESARSISNLAGSWHAKKDPFWIGASWDDLIPDTKRGFRRTVQALIVDRDFDGYEFPRFLIREVECDLCNTQGVCAECKFLAGAICELDQYFADGIGHRLGGLILNDDIYGLLSALERDCLQNECAHLDG